jgi:hypothetical protein
MSKYGAAACLLMLTAYAQDEKVVITVLDSSDKSRCMPRDQPLACPFAVRDYPQPASMPLDKMTPDQSPVQDYQPARMSPPKITTCNARDVKDVISAMNNLACNDFKQCAQDVGVDYTQDLIGFLKAVAMDCPSVSCRRALKQVFDVRTSLPRCSILSPFKKDNLIKLKDFIGMSNIMCNTRQIPTFTTCNARDVKDVISAMNNLACNDFKQCAQDVGVDYTQDLIGFLKEVAKDCSSLSCQRAMKQVFDARSSLPRCNILNPFKKDNLIKLNDFIGMNNIMCDTRQIGSSTDDSITN